VEAFSPSMTGLEHAELGGVAAEGVDDGVGHCASAKISVKISKIYKNS
jgi:hypothetical protein